MSDVESELAKGDPIQAQCAQLLYRAWTIMANASEGNWQSESSEWRVAATKWRDDFHSFLTLLHKEI